MTHDDAASRRSAAPSPQLGEDRRHLEQRLRELEREVARLRVFEDVDGVHRRLERAIAELPVFQQDVAAQGSAATVPRALTELRRLLAADTALLLVTEGDGARVVASGAEDGSGAAAPVVDQLPQLFQRLRRSSEPFPATELGQEAEQLGLVGSCLAVAIGDGPRGGLVFAARNVEHRWPSGVHATLRLTAVLLASLHEAQCSAVARARSEKRLQTVVSNVPLVLFALDPSGLFTLSEGRGLDAIGLQPGQVVGQSALEMYADHPEIREHLRRALAGETFNVTVRVDGTAFETWYSPVLGEGGRLDGVIGVASDVTGRLLAEAALSHSDERLALAVCGANEGLWDWNLRTDEVYYSPRFREMVGIAATASPSDPEAWLSRIHKADIGRVRDAIRAHVEGAEGPFEDEHRIRSDDGAWRWMLVRGSAVRDEQGRAYRMAGSYADTTTRREAEEKLLYDALHDPLTGLPNRNLLLQSLDRAIAESSVSGEFRHAVLLLDLDRFKVINDGVGHDVGDRLLIDFAGRLGQCLGPSDVLARLSGDEFVILLRDVADLAAALTMCETIQDELRGVFRLDAGEVFTSVSIGVVFGDASYDSGEDMLRDADTAMYRAKESGRGRHAVFQPRMRESALTRLQLETDLRRSVERDEFELHYQPICSLDDGSIHGFEALIRWSHPSRGRIAPDDFIPLAEETGLIVPIGRWMLVHACQQIRRWRDELEGRADLTMNVNLSSREFSRPDLVQAIRDALEASNLDPSALRIEITESLIMDNTDETLAILQQLETLGVALSIDDFGTGYSSLSRLHRFPIQAFKIDRSFVHRMELDSDNLEIVRAMVVMARSLGMQVIAEGVETPAQVGMLRAMGCRWGQGYHYSEPVSAEAARRLMDHSAQVADPRPHRPTP